LCRLTLQTHFMSYQNYTLVNRAVNVFLGKTR
jgi:hypothetical protein